MGPTGVPFGLLNGAALILRRFRCFWLSAEAGISLSRCMVCAAVMGEATVSDNQITASDNLE